MSDVTVRMTPDGTPVVTVTGISVNLIGGGVATVNGHSGPSVTLVSSDVGADAAGTADALVTTEAGLRVAGDATSVATAASDATTKANAAQTAAISAAATDATTKVGAEATARAAADALKISDLVTRAVTADATVADGEFIEADATSGILTVTGPAAGAKRWGVKKTNGTSAVPGNKVTISYLNSAGVVTTLDMVLAAESKVFRPSGSGYRVESGDTPKAGLDNVFARIVTYDIRLYGAKCDGTTDDSAIVNTVALLAYNNGGGRVSFPTGTTIAGKVIVYAGVDYVGQGYGTTVVKAPTGYASGTNDAVFITYQYATLTGTTSPEGPWGWSIRDMLIDGNKAGNATYGRGLSIYGINFTLANLRVRNCRREGIYSEGAGVAGYGGSRGGPESHWYDVKIHDGEQAGLIFQGPHDTEMTLIKVFDNCRTSAGIQVDLTGVNSTLSHYWGSYHGTTAVMRASCALSDCTIESGSTNALIILGNQQSFRGGSIFGTSVYPSAYGLQVGDGSNTPTGLVVDTKIDSCGDATGGGAINYAGDGGTGNTIKARIFQAAGTMVNGTPNNTGAWDFLAYGSATKPTFLRNVPTSQPTVNRSTSYYAGTGIGIGFGNPGPTITSGTGSPEGAITARVGSQYIRSDGAAGTCLYIKESGTGNTGWAVPSAPSLAKASNLSDLADAPTARTNLGLGTAATQATSAFDAAGAAAAAQAASQPVDSDLTAIAALTTTTYGRAFLALADAAAGRTALGLGTAATSASSAFDAAGAAASAQAAAIAASQPVDSDLTAIAALTTTTFGRSLLTQADAAATKTTLALVKGDVGLGNVDNTSDANKQLGDAVASVLAAPLKSTFYYGCPSGTGSSSTMILNRLNGGLMYVGRSCTLDRLGVNVTVVGDTGSVIRLALYLIDLAADTATLLVDGGTVAADSGGGIGFKTVTISQAVTRGQLIAPVAIWQGGTTTSPTVSAQNSPILAMNAGSATGLTVAQNNALAPQVTGVTGSATASFTYSSNVGNGTHARVVVRAS